MALILLDAVLLATGTAMLLALPLALYLIGVGIKRGGGELIRRFRLIWRLRNRLIVTYIFIGAVPVALLLAMAYVGSWIMVGQVATYLVGSELKRRALALETPAKLLSTAQPSAVAAISSQMIPFLQNLAPGAQVLVGGDHPFQFPPEPHLNPLPKGWDNFTGILVDKGKPYLASIARHGTTTAAVIAPINREIIDKLVPGIGSITLSIDGPKSDADPRFSGPPPPAYNFLDSEFLWGNPVDLHYWDNPSKTGIALLSVTTRLSAVLTTVFSDRFDFAQGILAIFIAIAVLLALAELVSVIIGISMTRAITGAVHNMYEGTRHIGEGHFAHRIPVRGSDQLAALCGSFNQMTEHIESLVVVAKEKERLQSELTIATEVQNQLFPRSAPPAKTIQMIGTCLPARSVSGDYYDYLRLPNGHLAIAIGDVAGKGISAALLMASIQSIMRTQLLAGGATNSAAAIVAQLNRQLYANTSSEKYATFFLGLYDEESRILTYTNAGHLSPLIVSEGCVTDLEVTGTVVGMFPAFPYEERSIPFGPGDIFVAFSDGVTEPENAYGEEFGTGRLIAAVRQNHHAPPAEIASKVMEAVQLWSTAEEQPDDMTVLIAKGIGA
jgi:sigma-B regulation protein RsbU (phosphoserine phosphatase)